MSDQTDPVRSQVANYVHPICQHASDPEKCLLFVEELEMFDSDLEFSNTLLSEIRAEDRNESQ